MRMKWKSPNVLEADAHTVIAPGLGEIGWQ